MSFFLILLIAICRTMKMIEFFALLECKTRMQKSCLLACPSDISGTKGPHHRSRIHSLQFQFEVVDNCEGERSYLRRERCDAVRERARRRGRTTTLSGMEPYFAVLFVWFNTLDDGIKKELIDGRFIIFGALSVNSQLSSASDNISAKHRGFMEFRIDWILLLKSLISDNHQLNVGHGNIPPPFQALSPDVVSRKGGLFPLDPRQLLHGPQQCGVGRRRVRGGRDRLPRVLQPQQLLHEVREDCQVYVVHVYMS